MYTLSTDEYTQELNIEINMENAQSDPGQSPKLTQTKRCVFSFTVLRY